MMCRNMCCLNERIVRTMKKSIMSFALALLLLCALPGSEAFADQYCNLGQVQAGSQINCYIASLPVGTAVSHDTLPAGCQLFTETLSDGLHLYLRGTPGSGGSYNFSINTDEVSGEKLICTILVTPGMPSVYTSADVDCYVGDRALVTASATVSDGGALSYQWFVSSSPSGEGTLIMGANAPEYLADTSRPGVSYYCCQVSNGSAGQYSSVLSQPVRVSVSELVVESIMVNTMPLKTRYEIGDMLETAGLSISVRMSGGTERVIDSGFEVSPAQFVQAGQQNVSVSYGGKTCFFPVTVQNMEESLMGIGMVKLPDKTEYNKGEFLDTSGLIFRAYTANGQQDLSEGFVCEPMLLDKSGSQTITLIYLNKTCTFTVTVKEGTKLLEVTSTPRKLTYAPGEALDTSGLVLKLTDGYDSQIISSGFVCEPSVFTSEGTQVVKVRYNDLLATFTVKVTAPTAATPAPSASPGTTPSPSAQPTAQPDNSQTPQTTARPNRIEHDSYETRSNRGTLVFIMVLCILALIVLGAMMVVINSGGSEAFLYKLRRLLNSFRSGRR